MPQRFAMRLAGSAMIVTLAGCAGGGQATGSVTPGPRVTRSAQPSTGVAPTLPTVAASTAPTGVIVLSATAPSEAFGSLFVVNADGSGAPTKLGRGDEPDWSPDGTQIAYVKDGGIWVMQADGARAREIWHDESGDAQWPVWSPDGSQIAFVEAPSCGPCPIGMAFPVKVMAADGSAVRALADAATPDRPAWSPDGQTIVFAGEWSEPATTANGLQSIRVEGGGQHQFTDGHDSSPRWSLDRRFAFLRAATAAPDGSDVYELFVANGDGSAALAVMLPLFLGGTLAWSPDGAWIAFQGTQAGATDIWLVRPDGTDLRNLTHSTDLAEGMPAWR